MNQILEDMLGQWEDSYERGEPLSPELLCKDHPELLEELKSQIAALQSIEANFGGLMGLSLPTSEEDLRASRLNQRLHVTSEFQISSLHASGGLGDVYVATEPQLHRKVAIKFPRKEKLNLEQMARFEREAQITGKLNHPGIVPVYSLKQDVRQQPCYVMRFVDGMTLRHRVEQLNRDPSGQANFFSSMEFRQLLQNFVAICNIVAYAHDQGIIHRDIKPENVIIGPFGETMLMDWGLAKILNEPEANTPSMIASECVDTVTNRTIRTQEGQVLGTPAFASPEQLQGRVDLTDARSDIYSLGATLHYLLTGSIRREENGTGLVLRHGNGSIVPSRLGAICGKAMNEAIGDRYQAVTTLREDVERYLAGEPISVVRETIGSRIVRGVRRRPGIATATLVSVMMAIVAGTVGSFLLNQKNRELNATNQQLETAVETALVAKKRATATSDLLSRALQAATPEVALGKEPTVRQLLDETSQRLRADDSINSLVAADTHQIIAKAYLSLGVYEDAQEHANLAASIYRRDSGVDSAEALTAQAAQAILLSRRDRDTEAIELARDALKRGRQVGTLDPESMVVLIDNYSHVISAVPNPNHEEIAQLQREAYELALKSLGAQHRSTLRMASNLATAKMDAGEFDEAEKLLLDIQKTHRDLLSERHPETLVDTFNLIALKFNKGEFQDANDLCSANLPIFDEVLSPTHQRAMRLRLLFIQSLLTLNKAESAASEAKVVLERTKSYLGPLHQNTFEARGLLATALISSRKFEEADTISNEQYETAKSAFGVDHSYTVQAVTLLFELADARGDLETMQKWFEHLRGSPWEADAQVALKAAQDKKK